MTIECKVLGNESFWAHVNVALDAGEGVDAFALGVLRKTEAGMDSQYKPIKQDEQ